MTAPRKCLLIVDDDLAIHRALDRTLRHEPFDLLHAYDAAEAHALLRSREDVAAVLSDQFMPGTNGVDLLIELRRRHPDLVTLLITGRADMRLVIRAVNEGEVNRFFTKPWDPGTLRGALRRLLGLEGPDAADRERVARIEARLEAELLPSRDARTGAFVIQRPA
jgi:two-component system probable response regulator PhcQ